MRFLRMTTRRLMAAVAVVAVVLAGALTLDHRSVRFRALAERHGSESYVWQVWSAKGPGTGEIRIVAFKGMSIDRKLADWHLELRDKYRRAARYPWLPVPPDPPEPK